MSRHKSSPYRYDRAAIKMSLELHGLEATRERWPREVVDTIARVMGLTQPYKNRNEWNPTWTPLLGTKPDTVLAGELGVPRSTVRVQRVKLGIPFADTAAFRKSIRDGLAQIPDDELRHAMNDLSARTGFSKYHLMAERRRREVLPASRRGRPRFTNGEDGDLRRVAVLAIRAAYPDAPYEAIARVIGVSRQRVHQILVFHGGQAKAS